MLKRDSTVDIPGFGLSYLRGIILVVMGIILFVLYLTKTISLGNAAIMAVILLFLTQGNAEVFLVAFILAMIIRCFCIEVYKIPTGSMEPTLHGDYNDGDRIIANKFGILFNPIQRYDVFLFKFPLDKSTSFIKRVVGLPNEELMINRGNLYYRPKGTDKFLIAKKALKTQESIWLNTYRWNGNQDEFTESWNTPQDSLYKIENGLLELQGGGTIGYKETIRDEYGKSPGRYPVSDMKLSFKVRTDRRGGEIYATIRTHAGNFSLHLYPQPLQEENSDLPNMTRHFRSPPYDLLAYPNTLERYIPSDSSIKSLPIDEKIKIEPNKEHLIEILNFDGTIYIKIDNKEAVKYDYISSLEDGQLDEDIHPFQIELGAKKHPAVIRDITIWRDLYYYDTSGILRENKPLAIPEGKYFAIGDNIPNSKDSRLWRMRKITLKDGTIIKCDAEPSSADIYQENGDIIRIKRNRQNNRGGDIWGMDRVINQADIVSNDVDNAPFIDADEIFGRALFVYWPIKRLKLIR
ncbi:MAG: signal peptidase I [Planctomycetes bacterium]|nr:signal peptidase I [Planctomycetota bacterium]